MKSLLVNILHEKKKKPQNKTLHCLLTLMAYTAFLMLVHTIS